MNMGWGKRWGSVAAGTNLLKSQNSICKCVEGRDTRNLGDLK